MLHWGIIWFFFAHFSLRTSANFSALGWRQCRQPAPRAALVTVTAGSSAVPRTRSAGLSSHTSTAKEIRFTALLKGNNPSSNATFFYCSNPSQKDSFCWKRTVEISTDARKSIQMPLAQVTAAAINVTLQTKMWCTHKLGFKGIQLFLSTNEMQTLFCTQDYSCLQSCGSNTTNPFHGWVRNRATATLGLLYRCYRVLNVIAVCRKTLRW